jgi:hypothetical protein
MNVSSKDMRKSRISQTLAVVFTSLFALPVVAEEASTAEEASVSEKTASFALVVGSNRPGQGQEPLSFARQDASRFSAVLNELGGIPEGHITKLHDPFADEIYQALQEMTVRIAKRTQMGEKTAFIFYYSGHARAAALNVGPDEISLKILRELLEAVPASFKLIVLDACQTGAISNIKGVTLAADFSYNSVSDLTTEGMAVIASSAASELAQESDRLKGSFFTHHLLAALRGAADANRDGLVTLDEAYSYTYNRTLVDTAKTAVGKQHVTLETELSGEGETVLSRPKGARAWVELPGSLDGEVLIYRRSDQQVMAEVYKAAKNKMTLALPPAAYKAVIRKIDRGYECDWSLQKGATHTVKIEACKPVKLKKLNAKGKGYRRGEHLFFEVGVGAQFGKSDRYNERLHDFGYSGGNEGDPLLHFSGAAYYSILRYLKVGIRFSFLDEDSYTAASEHFDWRAYRLGIDIRGALPLANDWLTLYLQAGGGPAFAVTHLRNDEPSLIAGDDDVPMVADEERFWGFHIAGGGGVQLTPWQWVGFFWQVEYIWAPVIENLIGDTHDSGGVALTTGVLGGF